MEITGKIINAFPEKNGISKAGKPWKTREYVLETINDNFPKKVYFDFFGDKADQYPLEVGQVIKLSFDIESREFNGKWYTSIRGWKSEPAEGSNQVAAAPARAQQFPGAPEAPHAPSIPASPVSPEDDLPF